MMVDGHRSVHLLVHEFETISNACGVLLFGIFCPCPIVHSLDWFFRNSSPILLHLFISSNRMRILVHRFVLSAKTIFPFLSLFLLVYMCNAQSTVTYNRGIGKVFTWGRNSNGQLYLGDGVTNATVDSHVPGIVTNLPKSSTTGAPILISGLAASTDFSLVLSGDGFLFSVGDNMKGQLGLGDHTSRKVRYFCSMLSPWSCCAVFEMRCLPA